MAFVHERPVRFEDVDAAGIVFFGKYFSYGHEAMEAFFGPLPNGGYVGLVNDRRIGFPAVHIDCDYKAPLRYGDVALMTTRVLHIGNRSFSLEYAISRSADGVHVATIEHVVATAKLDAMQTIPIPDDVREILEKHR